MKDNRRGTLGRIALRAALPMLCALAATIPARATDPAFGQILPPGGQRGTEVEVRLLGARLGDAQEILFTRSGISAEIREAADGEVKAVFRIAPDAPLGTRCVYIRTWSGISDLRLFSVGALKEIEEGGKENDAIETAPKIDLETTVNGLISREDVDYFKFDAAAGQRINFQVEALILGRSDYDAYITLFDPEGIEIAAQDDTALLGQDCYLGYTFETAGTYTVSVREAAYQGDGNSRYRFHVGTFPRPTSAFPAGGKPGEALKVRWLGDPSIAESEVVPTEEMNEVGLFPEIEGRVAPSSVPFRVNALDNHFDAEPNNDHASATQVSVPGAINGIIDAPEDWDWYKFDAKKDQTFEFTAYARRIGSPLDSVMGIQKHQGAGLAGDDDAHRPDSYFRYTIPEDGTYVVYMTDHLRTGSPVHSYRIEIAEIHPAVNLVNYMPGVGNGQKIVVPVGNRMATMLSVRRADIGGAMKVEPENMPDGLSVQVAEVPDGIGDVPILYSADPATTASARVAQLRVRPSDENITSVRGTIDQQIDLVRIQNNIPISIYKQKELPVSVVQRIPFVLELVEPKVPIVKNGAMNLTIRATRDEGYAEPIAIRLLWNPPGISSSTNTIAGDQTETTIVLNANGGAAVGDWTIAAIGNAKVGDANIEVSTQLAKLSIAEPWLQIAYEKVRTDQGTEAEMPIKLTAAHEFEGEAVLELVGLPNKATAEPLKITKDVAEAKYLVKVDPETPAGKFTGVFVRATIVDQGEPIVHHIGGAELRVDVPLPPKAEPTPAPDAPASAEPTPKPEGPQRGDRKPASGIAPFARDGQ